MSVEFYLCREKTSGKYILFSETEISRFNPGKQQAEAPLYSQEAMAYDS